MLFALGEGEGKVFNASDDDGGEQEEARNLARFTRLAWKQSAKWDDKGDQSGIKGKGPSKTNHANIKSHQEADCVRMARWSRSAHSFARADVRRDHPQLWNVLSVLQWTQSCFDIERFPPLAKFRFFRASSRKSFLKLFLGLLHVFSLKLDWLDGGGVMINIGAGGGGWRGSDARVFVVAS